MFSIISRQGDANQEDTEILSKPSQGGYCRQNNPTDENVWRLLNKQKDSSAVLPLEMLGTQPCLL